MKVKFYTKDKDTINFVQTSATYHGIIHDILPVMNEKGEIVNNCIILENIDSINYWEGSTINKILPTLKLHYKNIALSMVMTYISDLSIEK